MTISMKAGEIDLHRVKQITLEPLKGDNRDYLDILIQTEDGLVQISCYGIQGEPLPIVQEI